MRATLRKAKKGEIFIYDDYIDPKLKKLDIYLSEIENQHKKHSDEFEGDIVTDEYIMKIILDKYKNKLYKYYQNKLIPLDKDFRDKEFGFIEHYKNKISNLKFFQIFSDNKSSLINQIKMMVNELLEYDFDDFPFRTLGFGLAEQDFRYKFTFCPQL